MADIKNLNPVEIWRNFDKLTQVPRPSGHLEKIQMDVDLVLTCQSNARFQLGSNLA